LAFPFYIEPNAMSEQKYQTYSESEIIENKRITEEYYDLDYAKGIVKHVALPINSVWFRAELVGWETLPERNQPDRPLILATNHSGMAFPWDAMIFGSVFNEHTQWGQHSVRALSSPMLSQSNLMNPYAIPFIWKRTGAVDATFLNFETMMHQTECDLLLYPEGVPGIGKGFNKRYQLQELKTSYLRMSIKYKTDIVYFHTVNGEYVNPYSYNSKIVTRIVNAIGIPFLPLGIMTPLILLQPWIFYYGFPAKLTYVMGERVKPYEMIDKPYEEITQAEFKALSEQIRERWQKGLHEAEQKYGRKPFNLKELVKKTKEHPKLFFLAMPLFWAISFYEFERQYQTRKPEDIDIKTGFFRNILHILRIPFILSFYIPILGLIPLAIKGYRNHTLKKKK